MWVVTTFQDQKGDMGLKAIETAYEYGIVSLNHHLTRNNDRNQLLLTVC